MIEFPAAYEFLFEPHRYKVAYGGRGAAKSWAFARALLIQGAQTKLRVLCARETQKSIADSVHKLLWDQVDSLGLKGCYEVLKSSIRGANGTEFVFAGLKEIDSIKSAEGLDRVWVEEAQTVTRHSWEKLIPTIRKDGSEIWVSFNPDLASDDCYKRFVINPPPEAVVRKINWRDNPWFPNVLRKEMEHLRDADPDAYQHVWEGCCISVLSGAIYANELRTVDAEQRIARVAYDPTRPVMTFWDLGVDDSTAIWFAQASGFEYHLIDYEEDSGKGLPHYLKLIQSKPYIYSNHYLPHDARARELGSGRSIEELMRTAGLRVEIVKRLSVADGINAARTIFPQCWFDAEKCADGLQALRHYTYEKDEKTDTNKRQPLHNWASHAADSFRYFAVAIKQPAGKPAPARQREEDYSWMG